MPKTTAPFLESEEDEKPEAIMGRFIWDVQSKSIQDAHIVQFGRNRSGQEKIHFEGPATAGAMMAGWNLSDSVMATIIPSWVRKGSWGFHCTSSYTTCSRYRVPQALT